MNKNGTSGISVKISRYFNSFFLKTVNLFFSVTVPKDGHKLLTDSQIEQSLMISLATRNLYKWPIINGQKSCLVDFQTHNSLKLLAWILPKMPPSSCVFVDLGVCNVVCLCSINLIFDIDEKKSHSSYAPCIGFFLFFQTLWIPFKVLVP